MKMVKSLLLGSATGLVAIAGAQAADLPVKAKPVQYVKICSLYGAGFYYIPGTDTCLKVGGFIRAESNVNTRGGSFAQWQAVNFDDRAFNDHTMRARGVVTLDARSETAYGTLRSYINIGEQYTSAGPGRIAPAGLFGVWTNRAFIQFAGFTMGRAVSFFDFDPVSSYSNQTNTWGSSSGGTGIFVWAYTAQFGNGFSASISAEDGTFRRTAGGLLATAGTGYAGYRWPDVVGNLRVDQSWGSAQIMGAIHDVNPGYYTSAAAGTGGPGDEVGYALGAGLKLNLPMLGHGDFLITQFTYAKGALNYVGSGLPGGIGYNIQNGNLAGAVTVGFGPAYDATYGVSGGLDLTEGWSVTAGLQHNWMPGWKTSLYGAYGELNYSTVSSARIAAVAGPGALGSSAAPPAPIAGSANWSMYQIGSRTVWTPVKNLDISLEAMYNHLDTAYSNTPGYEDKGWWAGIFRVQRNFYP